VDSKTRCLVRYFGRGEEAIIPDEIDAVGPSCFSYCTRLRTVKFGSTCRIRSIAKAAFEGCSSLESISIPSSVTDLCEYCFAHCQSLRAVAFIADSQLVSIGTSAFHQCRELKSMSIPPSVEIIGTWCFADCLKLEEVIFTGESKLARIKAMPFPGCSSLQSLILPPLVESVDEDCFNGCHSLCTLTFSSPCPLRELLFLTSGLKGLLEISDSVEILRFALLQSHTLTLSFGSESRLSEVTVGDVRRRTRHVSRCFVRVSNRSLKVFRSRLEFEILNEHE
jgi:hypothetical protein